MSTTASGPFPVGGGVGVGGAVEVELGVEVGVEVTRVLSAPST